ncbi:hypothetical protein KCU71_g3750, partial [Aureobasidium melanogenum]
MQLPEGGLPEGYEGCTTIKEIAKRKKTLESQPSRTSTTSTFTGQSWEPPKTSPTGSRQFSTLRAVWTKSKESKFDEQEPAQDSQPEEWTKLEAEMLEAKRQYDQMRSALKSAQNLESGSQEVTENDNSPLAAHSAPYKSGTTARLFQVPWTPGQQAIRKQDLRRAATASSVSATGGSAFSAIVSASVAPIQQSQSSGQASSAPVLVTRTAGPLIPAAAILSTPFPTARTTGTPG